jgi:hypothetical protein
VNNMLSQLISNPSLSGPKIHFGNQEVINGQAGLYQGTPSLIPGPNNDDWNLIEWSNIETLDPSNTQVNVPYSYDPDLGEAANYSWATPDGETSFYSYNTAMYGWVYRLVGAGVTTDLGEHDVFFSSAQPMSTNMAGGEVDLSLSSRLLAETSDPQKLNDPNFYSEALIGLTFNNNVPTMSGYIPSQPTISAFIQIAVGGTGNVNATQSYFSLTSDGNVDTVISDQLRTENTIDVAGDVNFTQNHYNITAYLSDLESYLSGNSQLGPAAQDPSLWNMTGLYTGIITQGERTNIDFEFSNIELTKSDTSSSAPIEISPQNPNLVTVSFAPPETADSGVANNSSIDATNGSLVNPTLGFAAYDATINQAASSNVTPYSGPVAGLQNQYIDVTTDNLDISASTPGWFIHSGSGSDAISVNSGVNVLDGGTGSNFLTGGSGMDTFFADARNATSAIWSTINNFHAGDAVTVWGITPQNSSLSWLDGQGSAGYTGLTLNVTASGLPTTSLTLVGYTQADLGSSKLTVQTGDVDGSPYLYIHGNS